MSTSMRALMLMGLIPFVLFATAARFHWPLPLLPGHPTTWFIRYAVVIISFIAGSHWGMCYQHKTSHIPLVSNLITLVAWVCLAMPQASVAGLVLLSLFIALFIVDCALYKARRITRHILQYRGLLTTIVLLSILFLGHYL